MASFLADGPTLGNGRSIPSMQVAAVVLCLLMNLMDGFDLLTMAFTAPRIAAQWGIPAGRLGLLFSAGLAGMAVGALALSPLADIWGRRRTILLCLLFVAGGMIAAGFSRAIGELAAARFTTGVGVGAIISSTGAMVYEFSSDRYRGLAMGLMAVCFPAGATLGGTVALLLIDGFGWQGVFWAGGIATALLVPLVGFLMPESPSFLVHSRRPEHRQRGRALLAEMGREPPADSIESPTIGKLAEIFGPTLRTSAYALAALFLLVMLSFYFIINWAPKLVVQYGASESAGITAGLLLNLGGMAGGLAAGLATTRFGIFAVARCAIGAMGIAIAVFGVTAAWGGALLSPAALALGFTMFATQATIYILLAAAFPPRVRATAAGLISTAGRIGSVLGPTIGGALLANGLQPFLICILLGLPAIAAVPLVGRLVPAR